jgi:hypothetical protein
VFRRHRRDDLPQTTFVLADPFVGHADYGIDLGESEREAL